MARQIVNRVFYNEWEFDSYDELKEAAKIEGCVCGDSIREYKEQYIIEIYNFHQNNIRWKGVVK